jgi:DNA-binding response OmpR family regulator
VDAAGTIEIVDVVHDGWSALARAHVRRYDVIVLDRPLPVMHGDDVCRALVMGRSRARVLMLTAAGEIAAGRVPGLTPGADGYLAKPFVLPELAARVRALGRRSPPAAEPVLCRAGISLDPAHREALRGGEYVRLSTKEFAVLAELLRADGETVTAEHLLAKVWRENTDPYTGVLRLTVLKLRRKLGPPVVIENIRGVGYRIP